MAKGMVTAYTYYHPSWDKRNTMKVYNIKHISDLEYIVNLKNVDDFLVDFTTWLITSVKVKHEMRGIKADFSHFEWTDDKKHYFTIYLQQKK